MLPLQLSQSFVTHRILVRSSGLDSIVTDYNWLNWELLLPIAISHDFSTFLLFRWSSCRNQLSKLVILFVGMVIAKIEFFGQDCSERCKNKMYRSWFLVLNLHFLLDLVFGIVELVGWCLCGFMKHMLPRDVYVWSIILSVVGN